MSIVPEVAWQLDCLLGEGPIWLPDEGALWFVDIKRGQILRYDPASGTGGILEVGGMPSVIVPSADGGLLVGSGHSIFRLEQGLFGEEIARLDQPTHNRANDGTVDALGRFWLATMDNLEEQATGSVWCLDRGKLYHAGSTAVVTNGPAVNGDGNLLYRVDSGERAIWRHTIGAEPVLGRGELFVRFGADEGLPDGIAVDSEDCLWVALWDGWAVRRYAPDGSLMSHIPFPCARVTKLAFGGAGIATAFVTTARIGLSEAELADQPLAGSLFRFDAPTAGLAVPAVRLN